MPAGVGSEFLFAAFAEGQYFPQSKKPGFTIEDQHTPRSFSIHPN